jgi:polysaccharide biosynthesis protein PslH
MADAVEGLTRVTGTMHRVQSAPARPQLLFLCQTLPYPPDGGAQIRTYHVLRLLSRAFDVTALCFERSRTSSTGSAAAQDSAAGREALGRLASVEVFPIPQRRSRVRYAWDHFRSIVARKVYTTYLYDSRAFRQRLAAVLASRSFDIIHVDSLDLAEYLPMCGGVPIVCVHHDVEPVLLRRRAAVERSGWRRTYFNYQAGLRENVERTWCPRVALNVTASERDSALVKGLGAGARVAVVPNGVDTDEFRFTGTDGSGVAFVGGTTPFPNLDALDFFCEQILPHLRATGADGPVRWIGRASPWQQREYRERHGVELTGYVDDVRPLMSDAACHIVPLRVGGGTRLKILNAWAMGKPVVSTSIGCEGLECVDGRNVLIRDDPKDFAKAVATVLQDGALRRRLGEQGRATAERLYSWRVIGQEMIETYLAVAGGRSAAVPPVTADSAARATLRLHSRRTC